MYIYIYIYIYLYLYSYSEDFVLAAGALLAGSLAGLLAGSAGLHAGLHAGFACSFAPGRDVWSILGHHVKGCGFNVGMLLFYCGSQGAHVGGLA